MSFHGGDRHQVVSIIIQCRRQVVPIDGREEDRLEGQGGPRRDSVGANQEKGRGGAKAEWCTEDAGDDKIELGGRGEDVLKRIEAVRPDEGNG